MSRRIGIPFTMLQDAVLSKTNDTLANTDLTIPIAAAQRVHFTAMLPVTLAGAASGAKFMVDAPAAPTIYQVAFQIINGSSATVAAADIILAEAAFSNALANAATHYCTIEGFIHNGATAGNITIQFAQLVTDAGAADLLAGATMRVTYL